MGGDRFDHDCRPTSALCLGQFCRLLDYRASNTLFGVAGRIDN